jgi:4-hydroxybenzoate polyprenyltransferase
MKDIDGDTVENIKTLPVIFRKNGDKIVGALLAASFILVPVVFSFYSLYILALPAAFIGYKITTRKPYKEKYIFFLYFYFLVATILLIGGLILFSKTI